VKKIVLNISDTTYEKLRFESILEKKGIQQLIAERLLYKKFHPEVEQAFANWINQEIEKITKE
jgi:hypothetical protein